MPPNSPRIAGLRAARLAPSAVAFALALLSACSGPIDTPATRSLEAGGTRSPAATAPVATDAPASTLPPDGSIAAEPPVVALELVADGLIDPIGITAAPDGTLLVNEREGRVVRVAADGSTSVLVDLSERVLAGGERGLLGLALHPTWPASERAFVHYTGSRGETVVSELAGSADSSSGGVEQLDPDSERVLLIVEQPFANHNGGQLAFGPDGYLYLGLGDGGSGGDPLGHGQDTGSLLGSILRVDVDGAQPYAIPPDNPFAPDGIAPGAGAPETWVYGLRNPWRFSFDRANGDLWIGDVGQNAWEEIDRLPALGAAGANLGWNLMEGAHCFEPANCDPGGLVLPVAEYGHDLGASVTGGFVYRGSTIAGLAGWYLFADYGSGLLFGIPSDAQPPEGTALSPTILLETGLNISSFGEDPSGELSLVALGDGGLYRIVAGQ